MRIVQVYKIEFNDTPYFSWCVDPKKPADAKDKIVIDAKPNDKWNTPLNFDTHHRFFGPGPKTEHIEELKKVIEAKLS